MSNNGKYKNLIVQSENIQKHTNQKSIKTRKTYFEKYNRFLKFVSENYNTQKLSNIEAKHIYSYVEFMKNTDLNNGYVKSSLSAIRFCHSLTDSKNILPPNEKITEKLKLDLVRVTRGASRSWSEEEIRKALEICDKNNREDVKMCINLSNTFGVRLEEAVTSRPQQLKEALKGGHLHIVGKGGRPRNIPAKTEQQKEILEYCLKNKMREDYILVKDGQTVAQAKKSIQNFISRQRKNFEDGDRISSKETYKEVRRIRNEGGKIPSGCGVKTKLSMHGNRHSYAQNVYKQTGDKIKTSQLVGHNRPEVTDIYIK